MNNFDNLVTTSDKISNVNNINQLQELHTIYTYEEWKKIDGWPYEVSTLGRIRRHSRRKDDISSVILRGGSGGKYPNVILCDKGRKKTFYKHALVASTFIGPRPDGMQVDHINGDTHDCRLSNLRYITPSENIKQSVERGHSGINRWNSILNEDTVRRMRRLYESGWTIGKIAGHFDVNFTTTYHVVRRNNWKHVA